MAEVVRHRFALLLSSMDDQLLEADRVLEVRTLSEYGLRELSLNASQIVDPDAQQAKEFQSEILRRAIADTMSAYPIIVEASPLFKEIKTNPDLLPILVVLLMSEISTAIKGHGLSSDERRYVESDRALSRLHGILSVDERRVLFAAFKQYHQEVFDGYGVLDSDDVAISLLGKLRTPIWELRRRELGFDHIFVDETQLFNENERRLLPLLAKSTTPFVPIVLALDEAQDVYGYSKAGLATLGIEGVTSESLQAIHRSSRSIIRLAFFIIQRSTDLFGPDFPNFTGLAAGMSDDSSELNEIPRIESVAEGQREFGRFVLRRVRALRKSNLRRIAIVCVTEQYWQPVVGELKKSDLPLYVVENRGERLGSTSPIVAVSRPAHIGGQEFDAVLIVGAEQGMFPPRVLDNDALASAVEQQSLRELYISVTRARHRVVVALSRGATITPVLGEAQKAGLIASGAETD
jgi:superfamily I DNA/RNA helicase